MLRAAWMLNFTHVHAGVTCWLVPAVCCPSRNLRVTGFWDLGIEDSSVPPSMPSGPLQALFFGLGNLGITQVSPFWRPWVCIWKTLWRRTRVLLNKWRCNVTVGIHLAGRPGGLRQTWLKLQPLKTLCSVYRTACAVSK